MLGTLFAAIAGGLLSSSAFSSRYASVIFLPFLIILVALGSTTFDQLHAARVICSHSAVAAGLVISVQRANIPSARRRLRSPSVIAAHVGPGDVIVFCPDQLGPSTRTG